jgi:maltose alpha-D-glucosyltransferase/alpha-amylase
VGLSDLWYENAIIYCLDVETFMDSNGDGVGDFRGATRRLDYLWGLGVTCVWLMPFFPSPGRDDGYDVTDFCGVDPRYGSIADFVEFVREAQERGIRVIVDLVFNHTSDEHPWFQAARSSPDSPYRDYYVWRTEPTGDTSAQAAFPGVEDGVWYWDEQAQAWYLHSFYHFQPDLNITNASVRDELRRAMGLWLQLGASGFRVDAAPFIIDLTGERLPPDVKDPHQYLKEMRDFVSNREADAVFLAEVDLGPMHITDYFGGGNEFQMLFNFLVNRDYFLSLAQETADSLTIAMKNLPEIPKEGQWVNFARHHDELNLSRLTVEQREQVFKEFAPAKNMQLYNRGLRRRLAPMLGGDRRRLEMAYSLLFALPGTPMIYYGDEIGMGEDLDLPERMPVRTPMQWSSERHGGFSTADDDTQLVRPMSAGGKFGYKRVNVTQQRIDPDSLLNWFARLIRTRKECPEFGWGRYELIDTGQPTAFAHCCQWDEAGSVVAVHNLSRKPCDVTLKLEVEPGAQFIDMFSDRAYEPLSGRKLSFELSGYGYRWLRMGELR